ncbi:hypothetical protein [Roseobacter sp. HKCCA0434]|uniref:hypothetical protein n=1 Tax=Roseobacter sp. HKCCA0434 TaxID=3079297 RepID=UPI0029059067|nr:hypothetical protein [Roseobacter sp. HKCCA0434]
MIRVAIPLATALTLAACASGPDEDTFGGQLQLQGGAVAGIGEQWSEGAEMIARGEALVESGEDDRNRGRRLVRSGENDIDRGRDLQRRGERMQREAEEAYRRLQASVGAAG